MDNYGSYKESGLFNVLKMNPEVFTKDVIANQLELEHKPF